MKKTTLDQKLDLLKSRVAKTCLDDEYPEEKKQADEPEIKEVGLNQMTDTRSMSDVSSLMTGLVSKFHKLKVIKGLTQSKQYKLLDDGHNNIEVKSRRPNGGLIQPVRVVDPAWLDNIK